MIRLPDSIGTFRADAASDSSRASLWPRRKRNPGGLNVPLAMAAPHGGCFPCAC